MHEFELKGGKGVLEIIKHLHGEVVYDITKKKHLKVAEKYDGDWKIIN